MSERNIQKLLFVYNANSGLRSAILDSAHKILSPGTYECKLCDITFGVLSENRAWKDFRQNSDLELEFLHKDEFEKEYASKFGYSLEFPVVLVADQGELQMFISAKEFEGLSDAQDLINLIEARAS